MEKTPSKREGYVNLELDEMSNTQEVVVNMFIHEGELREQDVIWDLLIKKMPPVEKDTEFIRGFQDGYNYAVHVISERIHGPVKVEYVDEYRVEDEIEEFDITDIDDPE